MDIQETLDRYLDEAKQNKVLENRLNVLFEGYPYQAPFEPTPEENIQWYINYEQGWGCWIQNKYSRPMPIPSSIKDVQMYPFPEDHIQYGKKYKSPIPLHNADFPNIWRQHTVWVIDQNGWGSTLTLDDKYQMTSRLLW